MLKARVSTNGRKSRDFKIASSNAIEILSLSLSLSLPLSLFTFAVSLFRPKVSFERNREREVMICLRRFVSLFKKCFSRLGVGFLKKKSDAFNSFEHRVEKKRNISEFNQLSHKNNNCE